MKLLVHFSSWHKIFRLPSLLHKALSASFAKVLTNKTAKKAQLRGNK